MDSQIVLLQGLIINYYSDSKYASSNPVSVMHACRDHHTYLQLSSLEDQVDQGLTHWDLVGQHYCF